jgi:dUTP pyrophosphatase
MEPLKIHIKYFDKEMPKLEKISKGDWIDLRISEEVFLNKGEFRILPLGIGMKLPEGYEAIVSPRSSTFKNFGIIMTNSIGVIDNSYSGNEDMYGMPVYATRDVKIERYERVCQFRIQEIMPTVEFIEVNKLDEVSRGGFGTSGTK